MLIKDREPPAEGVVELLKDLLFRNLGSEKTFLIERELKNLDPAENGGLNAARLFNFYCADSPQWAVIHDLRIESNGVAAQIDHTLINRFFDIFLLDSKNYCYNLKIAADGEFFVFDGRRYHAIDSPIEENRKRVQVLQELLAEHKILPRRMGMAMRPNIRSYVLMAPGADVLRPPDAIYDTRSVVGADFVTQTLLKPLNGFKGTVRKLRCLSGSFKADILEAAARRLVELNKPCPVDYRQMFGLEEVSFTPPAGAMRLDAAVGCDYAI